jgi:hypothetical protein
MKVNWWVDWWVGLKDHLSSPSIDDMLAETVNLTAGK